MEIIVFGFTEEDEEDADDGMILRTNGIGNRSKDDDDDAMIFVLRNE